MGSQPARVYWTRRIIVLVLFLAVVSAIIWIVAASLAGDENPTATQAGVPPAGSTGGASSPAASPSGPSAPSSPSSTAQTSAGPAACTPSSVKVAVTAPRKVKLSAKQQQFTVSLTNTGSAPCELVVGPSSVRLNVASGADPIWTTADCDAWMPTKTVTVDAGQAHKFSVTWPVVRSSPTCKTLKTKLKPGTYVATAMWADTASARQVMDVTA